MCVSAGFMFRDQKQVQLRSCSNSKHSRETAAAVLYVNHAAKQKFLEMCNSNTCFDWSLSFHS